MMDWAKVSLDRLLDYVQPTNYIVESTDYSDDYNVPVLTAGKTFIKGFTNETKGVFTNLPVIIFDDFTTATQFVKFQFKVKSSAMKILVPKVETYSLYLIFLWMQCNPMRSDTHKRYWISTYSKRQIPLPPLPEQRAIVKKIESLFSELDHGIASLKQAQDQLKIYRQAVLKKAFEGKYLKSKVNWTTLDKACVIEMGQSPAGDTYNDNGIGVPLINGPVEFGKHHFAKTLETKFTTDPKKMCKKGDLILCVRGSTTGRINIARNDAAIGRGVAAIRYEANQKYLNYFMLAKRAEIYAKGTGSTFPSVSSSEIKNFNFPITDQKNQELIVQEIESRLSVCDHIEASIKENLAKSESLRQSILKKAFAGKLLTLEELAACKKEKDWCTGAELLERINNEEKNK